MLPEGLTNDGLNVVKSAKNAGVDVNLVNIMAMDYGRADKDYGDLAIQAVKSTKDQIKSAPEFDEKTYMSREYRDQIGTYYGTMV